MDSLAIVNIGAIASGDLAQPVPDGDCVLAEDGKISAIGSSEKSSSLQSLPANTRSLKASAKKKTVTDAE